MATTLTLDVIQYFPVGTTLGAYSFYSEDPDGTAPPVAATTTAVVAANGTVTFSGLTAATKYWVGTGSSPYSYVSATTTPASASAVGSATSIPAAAPAVSGYYVPLWQASQTIAANTFLAATAGRGACIPFSVSRSFTPSSFALEVTTAGAATFFRMGIYADSGNGSTPGSLLADLGQADMSTTGIKLLANTLALTAGTVYWLLTVPQGTNAGTVQVRNQKQAVGADVGRKAANASTASTTFSVGFDVSGVTGAMPTTLTLNDGANDNVPRVLVVVP